MPTDLQIERETTIVFNESSEPCMVWSASPVFQRRMAKLGLEPKRIGKRERGEWSGWYDIPKDWIKIRPPRVVQLSDEERARRAERARQRFAAKGDRS